LSPSFKVTRGYKYAMHIVLRGSAIIKAAGYPDYSLGVGEAVVHPVKYFAHHAAPRPPVPRRAHHHHLNPQVSYSLPGSLYILRAM
jgi:hypothetical protein